MDKVVFLYSNWEPIIRILVVGTLGYFSLVFLLRATHNRSLAQLNAFDFVITVALGASYGRVLTAHHVALAEAITAFALLIGLQYSISWLQFRSPRFAHAVTAPPSLLFYKGRYLEGEMRRQRVTQNELGAVALRHGVGTLEEVEAVIMEANGNFAVIKKHQSSGNLSLVDQLTKASSKQEEGQEG